MPAVRTEDLVEVTGFPDGVNNVARDTPPSALKSAINTDLSDEGRPRRRAGYTKVLAGAAVQSLFGHEHLPFLMARVGDTLVMLEGDPTLAITDVVATGLGSEPASYAVVNGELLWSVEGMATGRIDQMLQPGPLGPPPAPAPDCVALGNGGLPAGDYLVALSYALASGEEGGILETTRVTLPAAGRIQINLPDPPDEVETIRIWRTEADGTVLQHVDDVIAGIALHTIATDVLGRDATALHLQPLPPGQIIRTLNGITWVAHGSQVYHGDATYPRLCHPGHHRLPYRDRVTMMEPVGEGADAGMFIAAGKRTFYVGGGRNSQLSQKIAHPHGAVPGTGMVVPGEVFNVEAKTVAYWMGSNGVPCVGLPGGGVIALTQNTVAMDRFERGASLLREVDGLRSVITAGRGGVTNSYGAGDSVDLVHYRNGIAVQ